jgi:hypothetical protein
MKKILTLAYLTVVISFFACKKNDTTTPQQKTYLVKEVRSNGTTIDYKYDNQNRFAGHVYRDASSNYQETFTTIFAANNLPSELVLRDVTNSRAYKYNYTYDLQNRCTKIEVRDSINPTTYTLRTTYDFTFSSTKIIRTATNAATGQAPRLEYTIDANENYSKDEFYNFAGVLTTETTYTMWDDKINPYNATFGMIFLSQQPKNNYTSYNYKVTATGATTTYTAINTYNADNYPTQTVWNNGFTYNYTYEKR